MASAYDKLRRILTLECEHGCKDRAVIGGLQRFLTYWEKEAREEPDTGHPVTVDAVIEALSGYEDADSDARRDIIIGLLERMTGRAPEPAQEGLAPEPAEQADQRPLEDEPDDGDDDADDALDAAEEVAERPVRAPRRAPAGRAAPVVDLHSPLTALRGVSSVNQERLARLGLHEIRDLITFFPRRYDDFSALRTINRLNYGEEVTVVGVISGVKLNRTRSGQTIVRVAVSDGTGTIEARWFNQPYLERRFTAGKEIVVSGKVDEYLGRLVFTAPEWEPLQRELLHTGRLVPVYPLTEGVSGRWLRRIIKGALDAFAGRVVDPLPADLIESQGLMGLGEALMQIHFPDDVEALGRARHRLCFDEFLLLQLGVLRQRREWRAQTSDALTLPPEELEAFVASLPFPLTGAQRRAIDEIMADMAKPVPMSRLLQGDVGSGKTIVAAAAILTAVGGGRQAAVMAPTAILAEQHYQTLTSVFQGAHAVRCVLLLGGMPEAEKARVREAARSGEAQVVIGTHALIQEAVDLANLGLAVVDEQHRFGVMQRSALRDKGADRRPHMLVMSATPIPRSLALTVYGDLDLSVLDEMPPNRQTVITAVRDSSSRERIYAFLRSQAREGRQAFIICPLVEESDKAESWGAEPLPSMRDPVPAKPTASPKGAVEEHARLQRDVFAQFSLGLLHGRMSPDEKEQVMADFRAGKYQMLVSTSVVEVGIDIPNATAILVEGADRFGLAQLHQLRGRVGRGEWKSYCILLSDDPSEEGLQRLRIMEETLDGFTLAERDLEMRGPGDLVGVRQHGLPALKVARLSDRAVLEQARAAALALHDRDPDLARPEHRDLATSVEHFWSPADLS
jgi:ATP-dependent DNA helicase RecG